MLTGVECIGPRLTDSERSKLQALQPGVVKLRRPELVPDVLSVCPDARFILRPDAPGYDGREMLHYYLNALPVLQRYHERILCWIIANEPNLTEDPQRDTGRDPLLWLREALWFLGQVINPPVPLARPPLQPHWRIAEWLPVLRALPQCRYRAWHCYWQQEGPATAVLEMQSWLSGIDPAAIIVDELNGGDPSTAYRPTVSWRTDECLSAMRLLADYGAAAASVFCLEAWDARWASFVLPVESLRMVLAVGAIPTEIPLHEEATMPEFRYGFEVFAEEHPEVGQPSMDEVQLAPGVAMQMTSRGILWFCQAAADVGNPPIRFSPDPTVR